ncbi:MAG: hypothetical protein WCP08_06335 [Prolixibacteraceae bacterium]
MEKNRREFFRKVGQLSCLSVLIGGAAMLAVNHRIRLNGCNQNQFCRNCGKLSNCSLEPAKKEMDSNRKI